MEKKTNRKPYQKNKNYKKPYQKKKTFEEMLTDYLQEAKKNNQLIHAYENKQKQLKRRKEKDERHFKTKNDSEVHFND